MSQFGPFFGGFPQQQRNGNVPINPFTGLALPNVETDVLQPGQGQGQAVPPIEGIEQLRTAEPRANILTDFGRFVTQPGINDLFNDQFRSFDTQPSLPRTTLSLNNFLRGLFGGF